MFSHTSGFDPSDGRERWDFGADGHLLHGNRAVARLVLLIGPERAALVGTDGVLAHLPHASTVRVAIRRRARRHVVEIERNELGVRANFLWRPTIADDAARASELLVASAARHWLDRGLRRLSVDEIDRLDELASTRASSSDRRERTWEFPLSAVPIVQTC